MEDGAKAFSINVWAYNAGVGRDKIEVMKANSRRPPRPSIRSPKHGRRR